MPDAIVPSKKVSMSSTKKKVYFLLNKKTLSEKPLRPKHDRDPHPSLKIRQKHPLLEHKDQRELRMKQSKQL